MFSIYIYIYNIHDVLSLSTAVTGTAVLVYLGISSICSEIFAVVNIINIYYYAETMRALHQWVHDKRLRQSVHVRRGSQYSDKLERKNKDYLFFIFFFYSSLRIEYNFIAALWLKRKKEKTMEFFFLNRPIHTHI